jgi:predicted ATPase
LIRRQAARAGRQETQGAQLRLFGHQWFSWQATFHSHIEADVLLDGERSSSSSEHVLGQDSVHASLGNGGDCQRRVDDSGGPGNERTIDDVQPSMSQDPAVLVAHGADDRTTQWMSGERGCIQQGRRLEAAVCIAGVQCLESALRREQKVGQPGIGQRRPLQSDPIRRWVVPEFSDRRRQSHPDVGRDPGERSQVPWCHQFDQARGLDGIREVFVHALHRKVLYDHVPPTRRAELHRRIGEGIEALYSEDARELAAELAVHFEQGRDDEKAVAYFHRAAENAARRSANREAIGLAQRGLQLLAGLPQTPERAYQELALRMALGSALISIRGYSAPEVEQEYGGARELCRRIGEIPELFRVLWGLARFYLVRTPLDVAREFGEELVRLAERACNRDFLLQALNSLGAPPFHLGEFERARDHFDQGLALYDPNQHHGHAYVYVQDPRVVCLARSGLALWCLGYPDQALRRCNDAIVCARQLSHPFSEAFALNFAAMLHEFRREWPAARELSEAAIALSEQQGFSLFVIMGMLLRGAAVAEAGNADEGRQLMSKSSNAAKAAGAELIRSYGVGMLARAYTKLGRIEEARAAVAEALELVHRTGERFYEAELHRLHGQCLLLEVGLPDSHVRAEACFRQAIDVATRQQAKSWKLRAVMSLARLYERRGREQRRAGWWRKRMRRSRRDLRRQICETRGPCWTRHAWSIRQDRLEIITKDQEPKPKEPKDCRITCSR